MQLIQRAVNSLSKLRVPRLKKELGLTDLILIGVGGTIEASIFVLIAPGAAIAGRLLPLSFALGGILALAVALIYAEVSTSMPTEGADLRFIFKSFTSDLWSFITAWLVILGDLAYFALNLLGLALYVKAIFPINHLVFAAAVLLIVTIVNLRGVKRISSVEGIITMTLLFFFAVFIGWVAFNNFPGLQLASPIGEAVNLHTLGTILAGTALIYTTFIGYEDITSVAGEVREPRKILPKALILTVVITACLYLVISFLAVQIVPIHQLKTSESPLLLLAQKSNVPTILVTLTAILAILSTIVVALLVASRKLFALSQEGYLKNWFGKVNRRGVPTWSILFCSVVAAMLLLTNSIKLVAYLGNSVYLVGIIATTLALIIMRNKDKGFDRWFRVPFFPILPILVIIVAAVILIFIEREAILYMFLWAVGGGLLYLFTKATRFS